MIPLGAAFCLNRGVHSYQDFAEHGSGSKCDGAVVLR